MLSSVALRDGSRGTPGRLIKIDHSGEFGAVNIYRAQIVVARLTAPALIPVLNEFLSHERRHLNIFTQVLASRGIARCKSYWFCGIGGWVLGFLTALFGKAGIMACTAAVETVVTGHLIEQLQFLRQAGDAEAYSAVASIVQEELEHKEHGVAQGKGSVLFRPLGVVVAASTSFVIWLGSVL